MKKKQGSRCFSGPVPSARTAGPGELAPGRCSGERERWGWSREDGGGGRAFLSRLGGELREVGRAMAGAGGAVTPPTPPPGGLSGARPREAGG